MYCMKCGQQLPEEDSPRVLPYSVNATMSSSPSKPKRKSRLGGCCLITFLSIIGIFVLLIAAIVFLVPDQWLDESEETGGQISTSGTYGADLELSDLRDFYTEPIGDGNDVITLMVYMIGSDLETIDGSATSDLEEMMEADFGDNVNLIVMTGGAETWNNNFVSSDTCQYWQITDGKAIAVNDDVGFVSMAIESTLTNFINDTVSEFPANRYGLIFWNHGGGTISGFGWDEYFPDDCLTLDNISDAINSTAIKFDFIGFDACLMATAETAVAMEPHADYLIASEELVPGSGWYYTDWLTTLGQDTSITTLDLSIEIIDDFIESCALGIFSSQATLSVIELRQMPYTYSVLCDYFENATMTLQEEGYAELSTARNDSKEFGDGEMDQIDIVDFVNQISLDGSDEVIEAVGSAVQYYNSTITIEDAYGLAIYFPYDYPEYYSEVQSVMVSVGYGEEYIDFFDQFVSAMVGGQSGWQNNSQSGGQQGDHELSDENWYQEETASAYEEGFIQNEYDELIIDEKGENFVLSLSDEEWDQITGIEIRVLLDYGDGYMDLGSDNVYEWDEDGDLLIAFDYTWVTLDGHVVPFYAQDEVTYRDGSWMTYGTAYGILNGGDMVEILVYWDSEHADGYVEGYRKISDSNTPVGKGTFSFEKGDTLEWIFDCYDYDFNYTDSYILGDTYTYTGNDIIVSYDDVGNNDALVYFELTDIYQNTYVSEAVIYTD